MPEIVPGEILDLGNLERGVKRILDVLHRLAGLASAGVREHVGASGKALRIQRLQCRYDRRVQRHGVRPTTLGPWHANDAV